MTPTEYQALALRTMADQGKILKRNYESETAIMFCQLDNAARGMAGDVGEVNTCVQRCLEYGKPLDLVNLKEELGDVLWRIVQACDAVGFTLEEVMRANIAKLSKRYPDKYTDERAAEENRDREAEREAIEQKPPMLGWFGFGADAVEEFMRLCDNIHRLPEQAVVKFVELALKSGWRIDDPDQCVCCERGDPSWGWAAEWKTYCLPCVNPDNEKHVRVPHWLARRMIQLNQIPSGFQFPVNVVDRNGSPVTNSVGESLPVYDQRTTGAAAVGYASPTPPAEARLAQTGQGWAEPPVEEPEQQKSFARDADYPNWCSGCGKVPVHKTNTIQLCPDCAQQARRRRGEL